MNQLYWHLLARPEPAARYWAEAEKAKLEGLAVIAIRIGLRDLTNSTILKDQKLDST